jgi:hypothetical protein
MWSQFGGIRYPNRDDGIQRVFVELEITPLDLFPGGVEVKVVAS